MNFLSTKFPEYITWATLEFFSPTGFYMGEVFTVASCNSFLAIYTGLIFVIWISKIKKLNNLQEIWKKHNSVFRKVRYIWSKLKCTGQSRRVMRTPYPENLAKLKYGRREKFNLAYQVLNLRYSVMGVC